jgi:ubiquinol-cytochrome c reductase iron-sulfur subunit
VSPRRAELAIAGLLGFVVLAAVAFVVSYIEGADTQALGISAGVAMLALAAAAILAAATILDRGKATEERPHYAYRKEPNPEVAGVRSDLREPKQGISRRRMLGGAAGLAGTALGGALVVPLASLGPDTDPALTEVPWREGLPLVDENDVPVTTRMLDVGGFLTAFPEGAEKNTFGAPVVVVRVDPDELELPAERAGWAPEGFLAYSKICTHAGCAVNLYRSPLYEPVEPKPALVCPCHYSTFDVRRGGDVVFGPAGRPLPQLPLRIDGGALVAAGEMSGRVGPAWRGVRE